MGDSLSKLGSKLIVSIYLDSGIGRRARRVHCIYCGNPIFESNNGIRSIVDNKGDDRLLTVGLIIQCKRCKQRYRVVMHERMLEI